MEYQIDKSWLTPIVIELAKSAKENLTNEICLVLSDALEDAGCNNELILKHFRGETNAHYLNKECALINEMVELGAVKF